MRHFGLSACSHHELDGRDIFGGLDYDGIRFLLGCRHDSLRYEFSCRDNGVVYLNSDGRQPAPAGEFRISPFEAVGFNERPPTEAASICVAYVRIRVRVSYASRMQCSSCP